MICVSQPFDCIHSGDDRGGLPGALWLLSAGHRHRTDAID